MDAKSLTAGEILSNARRLLPTIEGLADAAAEQRRLPVELVAALKAAGVFRMPMPASWGGPEMTPREQTELIEMLSAADPSVGWCVMIGSDAGYYSAFLDDDAARRLWPDLDMVTAGWISDRHTGSPAASETARRPRPAEPYPGSQDRRRCGDRHRQVRDRLLPPGYDSANRR